MSEMSQNISTLGFLFTNGWKYICMYTVC